MGYAEYWADCEVKKISRHVRKTGSTTEQSIMEH
jgi:hypothetical protein